MPSGGTSGGVASGAAVRDGLHDMTFDLDEIRAVSFCCNECRTAVSFPRIRWANLPECCPNCGAAWMEEPAPEFGTPENNATQAFKAVKAFRDALQALISVSRTAGFTIGLETIEPAEAGDSEAKKTGHSAA